MSRGGAEARRHRVMRAYELVEAKRTEHQRPAGLVLDDEGIARAETLDDHHRAGEEWIRSVAAEHDLNGADALETMVRAMENTVPNLHALVVVGSLRPQDAAAAAFGGGFWTGLAVGLELGRVTS